jgi:hypothetical protein
MICQRIGSGNAAQVGIPFGKLRFLNSQKISPSVVSSPWLLAQWSSNLRPPAAIASG